MKTTKIYDKETGEHIGYMPGDYKDDTTNAK